MSQNEDLTNDRSEVYSSLSQKSLLPCLQQSDATTGVTISEDTATYGYERPC